jgi:hypothetical protein
MRAAVGPVLAHLSILGAGFGVLALAGQIGPVSLRRVLAAAGLAYVAGAAGVMTVVIVLMVAGVGLSLQLFAGVCVVLALPFAATLVRRSAWRIDLPRPSVARLREAGPECWIVIGAAVLFGLFALAGLVSIGNRPLSESDSWSIWGRKGVLLFFEPRLPDVELNARVYVNARWDYPLLMPLVDAMQFRAAGRAVAAQAHIAPWLLFVSSLWGAAFVSRRTTRPIVAAGLIGGVLALLAGQALQGLADLPVAGFLGIGALAVGQWLEDGRPSDLALGCVMLAGAAGTKNEGAVGALIVLVVAVAVHLPSRDWRRAGVAAGALVAVAVVAVLPWRLWLASHNVESTTPLGQGLSPSFLISHADRAWPSFNSVYGVLVGGDPAQLVMPFALALLVVRWRQMPRVTAFYLAAGVLYLLSLVWAYWVSPLPLSFVVATSVTRIYFGVMFLAVAAILQLAGRAPLVAQMRSSEVLTPAPESEPPSGAAPRFTS